MDKHDFEEMSMAYVAAVSSFSSRPQVAGIEIGSHSGTTGHILCVTLVPDKSNPEVAGIIRDSVARINKILERDVGFKGRNVMADN